MDALTCLFGVTARKSLSLNCISHSPNTSLLLNVTQHLMWTLKTLWSLWICSCRRIRLIWSCSLSSKNSHLWEMTASRFFFWWKGQREMHHVPLTPRSLWLFLKTHMYSTYAVIKSPAGDVGAGSRGQSLKRQKCHQPHRGGDVSQGTLTGRQLNWLWRLLCRQNAVWCGAMSQYKNTTTWQDWKQNKIKEPQNLIVLSLEPFSLQIDRYGHGRKTTIVKP